MLGICVGMQWLFDGSAEAPGHPGLELLPGTCDLITDEDGAAAAGGAPAGGGDAAEALGNAGGFKVPHVGWNSLHRTRDSWLLEGVGEGDQVYFTHSYAAPVTESCVGSTRYGVEFAAAVERGAVGGVQFHPEKSDVGLRRAPGAIASASSAIAFLRRRCEKYAGLRILRNFLRRAPG